MSKRRSHVLGFKAHDAERDLLDAAAESADLSLSAWMRARLLRAARAELAALKTEPDAQAAA